MGNEKLGDSALSSIASVKEFSMRLLESAAAFQAALHGISAADTAFADAKFAVLTEIYGVKARAFVLQNDPANHVLGGLGFSQSDLLALFDDVTVKTTHPAISLSMLRSIVISVATFSVSLGEGREEVVDFLYTILSRDILTLEC